MDGKKQFPWYVYTVFKFLYQVTNTGKLTVKDFFFSLTQTQNEYCTNFTLLYNISLFKWII